MIEPPTAEQLARLEELATEACCGVFPGLSRSDSEALESLLWHYGRLLEAQQLAQAKAVKP